MADHCPTCGALVKVVGSDEGTYHYEPVVDEAMERVREMAEDKRRSVRMAEGPTAPRMRERYGKQADALEALLTRLQAYEAVVEAARALSQCVMAMDGSGWAEANPRTHEARKALTRALDSLPDEGER